MGRVTGKRVLITAAGAGIGRSAALTLSREGATVWASDIDPAKLDILKRQDAAIRTVALDVLNEMEITSLAQSLGAIDVLFNCAGYVAAGSILDCSEEDWDFSFDLNVKSMFRVVKAFLPAMLSSGRGASIINMASIASSVKGAPNRLAYCASKAAVIGFTKSIAADYSAHGIRCNAICPATIDTPSLHQRIDNQAIKSGQDRDKVHAAFVARQAMGRLGTAEEVAALVTYLASDESTFTTGTAQIIDGGWSN
jgi:2-keto-3-deoxy-L-fuconate dehydrogenase